MEHAIDHQALVGQTQGLEFFRGARGLADGAFVGPRHQHHGGLPGVTQGIECGLEAHFLHLQARVRPEAGSTPVVAREKATPGLGQAEQTQGVARGRGIKDDVVVGLVLVRQERGELVKGSNLGGAGTRQLLAHRGQFCSAGIAGHLRHHALAVGLGRVVGIDVEHRQARHLGYRHRRVLQLHAQHLIQVGGGVGADQQHPFAAIREVQRHGGR